MKCCVSTVCAIFQCDEFAGDINKKNCMHNLNVVRESFRTQNERKRQMKRDQRNWKMIIISFFSRFLLLHIIIRTAQTFKNEDNAAAKLKWHEWKQSQRNKHKCIVQCTYLYHFGRAERRSANCIAIFRRLFGSMQHFADVHSLFWSFWMHSIQTHDFFSFFSISFLHRTEIHQSHFEYFITLSSLSQCSHLFTAQTSTKQEKKSMFQTDHNYTMSIGVGFRICAKMPNDAKGNR